MSGPTLAISYNSRMLGAALYEEDTCVVRILNDITEDEDFKMLKSCKLLFFFYSKKFKHFLVIDEVNPSLILANKIQDAVYIGALRQFCTLWTFTTLTCFLGNHKPFDLSTITLESDKSELTDEQKAFVREKNLLDSTNTGTLKDSMSKEDIPCETCDDVEMDTGKIDQEKEDGECDTTIAIEKSSQEMEKLGIADKNQEEGEIEDEDDDEEEEKKIPIVLTLLPNMAFGWEDAKKRLEKLVADGVNDTSILASFRFDFEARNMVQGAAE